MFRLVRVHLVFGIFVKNERAFPHPILFCTCSVIVDSWILTFFIMSHSLLSLFQCSNYSRSGHWEPLQTGFFRKSALRAFPLSFAVGFLTRGGNGLPSTIIHKIIEDHLLFSKWSFEYFLSDVMDLWWFFFILLQVFGIVSNMAVEERRVTGLLVGCEPMTAILMSTAP